MKTELTQGTYKGLDAVFLENSVIKATVLPRLGAKIASLIYKPQDFEVFFRPPADIYPLPEYGANFAAFDTSGADEMFPTIDACDYPDSGYPGAKCPDHGELWSLPWTAEIDPHKQSLKTETRGVAFNYQFRRTLTLNRHRLRFEYELCNMGAAPLFGLWAFHGLVACDEQTRVTLPRARMTNRCQVLNVKEDDLLGNPGGIFDFPDHQQGNKTVCLDAIRPQSLKLTRKYYVSGPVEQGKSSLTLNRGSLKYTVVFPEEQVPYLGIWINEGGFKNEYNCALEPATGFYDSLDLACTNKSLPPLLASEIRTWWMEIVLGEPT